MRDSHSSTALSLLLLLLFVLISLVSVQCWSSSIPTSMTAFLSASSSPHKLVSLLSLRQRQCRLFTTTASQPWLPKGSPVYKYFQNGQFVESMGEAAHPVKNPATNELLGLVPELSSQEFDATVQLSKDAFLEWKRVPLPQRQRVMMKLQKAIREDYMEDLAHLITLENGKTLADARGDVFRGLEMVESACWMAPNLLGDSLAGISSSMDCVSYREPLGVTAGICPFNFPAMSKFDDTYDTYGKT